MVVQMKAYIGIKPGLNGNKNKFSEVFQFLILIGNGSSGGHYGGGRRRAQAPPQSFLLKL